jgi:hypothetical protein
MPFSFYYMATQVGLAPPRHDDNRQFFDRLEQPVAELLRMVAPQNIRQNIMTTMSLHAQSSGQAETTNIPYFSQHNFRILLQAASMDLDAQRAPEGRLPKAEYEKRMMAHQKNFLYWAMVFKEITSREGPQGARDSGPPTGSVDSRAVYPLAASTNIDYGPHADLLVKVASSFKWWECADDGSPTDGLYERFWSFAKAYSDAATALSSLEDAAGRGMHVSPLRISQYYHAHGLTTPVPPLMERFSTEKRHLPVNVTTDGINFYSDGMEPTKPVTYKTLLAGIQKMVSSRPYDESSYPLFLRVNRETPSLITIFQKPPTGQDEKETIIVLKINPDTENSRFSIADITYAGGYELPETPPEYLSEILKLKKKSAKIRVSPPQRVA